MWHKISSVILRYRILLLVIVALLTSFMAWKGKSLQLEYVYATLLPEENEVSVRYKEFKELFGDDTNTLVMGLEDENFFQVEKFNHWKNLGDTLKSLTGINQVLSIGHAFNISKNTEEKKFDIVPIVQKPVETQQELDSIKQVIFSLPFYKGLLYNDTTNFYLMALTVDPAMFNSKEREPLVDSLKQYVSNFSEKYQLKIHYSGLPYTRTTIAQNIRKESSRFIGLAALVTAITLFLFFRSFRAVLFSMLVVGAAVMWVFGMMALFGFDITILTTMVPPLTIVIGVPNCVFLLNKYHYEFRKNGNKIRSLKRVIEKIGNATFLTNLTTAAGFGTFVVTNNRILIEFGIVAFLSILVVFVLSLILIPCVFSFQKPPSQRHTKHLDRKWTLGIVDFLCRLTVHHRRAVYTAAAIIIVGGIFGMSKIKTTGYIIDDIPEHDPVYIDLKFFEKQVNGVMPFEICVDTKRPRGVLRSSTLTKIDSLQERLKKYPELAPAISIVNGVKFAKQAYYNGNPDKYSLPKGQERNFILSYLKQDKDKSNLLMSFVDSTSQVARISVKVKDVGSERISELENSITAEVNELFPADKYDTKVTGSSIVYTRGTSYLVHNLFTSLGLAVVIIALFMFWMFRSGRMVVVSLIPNLIPLIFTAALMGYFGVSIKPSTVLVFSIAFGISVDDTIHFLAKYRQELAHFDWNIRKSVLFALRETGVSMMYTSIVLYFGFSIFTASNFGGTVALGLLVSVTLLIAMLSNLILLPSLLLTMDRWLTNKAFKEPLLHIYDEEEDIDLEQLKISETKQTGGL